MKLGFIGLGHLGKAVASRLIECGHELSVYNRTASKADGMKASICSSPKEVVQSCDIVFLCMFDSDGVRNILNQEDGILSSQNLQNKIIIDLSTNHFKDVVEFHQICEDAGITYLESPVLGSVIPATKGALTVLVSGSKDGFDKVKVILEDIGQNIFYLGSASMSTKMKLINNLALGTFMATISEALAFGEDVGISKENILDILSVGGGKSLVLDAKKKKLLENDFSTHFSNALIYKDLHCLQDLAYENKKTLFTGSVIKELYAKTFEEGFGDEDFCSVYKVLKRK